MPKRRKILPFLWFNNQAEEAARFYVKLFKNSRITQIERQGEGKDAPVFWLALNLDGCEFHILNGGPHYQLNPAFSLTVECGSQKEVDKVWAQLGEGGQELQCGWITDRFGLTWQIVPKGFHELMADPDPARRERAHAAMMQMQKLDIHALLEAAGPATKAAKKTKKKRSHAKVKKAQKSAKKKAKPRKK